MLSRNTLPLHQFIAQSMNRGTAHPVQVLNLLILDLKGFRSDLQTFTGEKSYYQLARPEFHVLNGLFIYIHDKLYYC